MNVLIITEESRWDEIFVTAPHFQGVLGRTWGIQTVGKLQSYMFNTGVN